MSEKISYIKMEELDNTIKEIVSDLSGEALDTGYIIEPTQEDIVGTNKYKLGEI